MKKISAFAPANISLLFTVVPNHDPAKMGSKGLGFTIDQGIKATVSQSTKMALYWNEKEIQLPVVYDVIASLTQELVEVRFESSLPLGCGFGLSGASALATAYALNELFSLKKDLLHLAKLVHKIEVISRTGLGDISNQYFGGFCLKTGVSSLFKVQKLPFIGSKLYYIIISELSTKEILDNKQLQNAIYFFGNKSLQQIVTLTEKEEFSLRELFSICYEFCKQTELLKHPEVIKIIEACQKQNIAATMILVGNAVIAEKPFPDSKEIIISDIPAHVIST